MCIFFGCVMDYLKRYLGKNVDTIYMLRMTFAFVVRFISDVSPCEGVYGDTKLIYVHIRHPITHPSVGYVE